MISVRVEEPDLKIVAERLSEAIEGLIERAAEYAEEEMRRRAPERTGRLKRSIRRRVNLARLEAEVGPTVPYAIYVELGTRPHIIRPVRASALRFEVEGQIVFAKLVRHPGTRPQPFIWETAEAVEREVERLWSQSWRG